MAYEQNLAAMYYMSNRILAVLALPCAAVIYFSRVFFYFFLGLRKIILLTVAIHGTSIELSTVSWHLWSGIAATVEQL